MLYLLDRCTWSLALTAMLQLLCIMQRTWQKEGEPVPLPEFSKYFKTGTDSEVILALSTILKSTNPWDCNITNSCVYDVTIVNSEYANDHEITLYWNWTAILLKVNATRSYNIPT